MDPTPTNTVRRSKKKIRYLIEEKIALLLYDSYYYPSRLNENGTFFIDNSNFAANIKILSRKLGINANSLNKDFRFHNIKCIQRFIDKKTLNLIDLKGWRIFQHSNPSFSLENVLKGNFEIASKWQKTEPTKPIKKKIQRPKKQFEQTFIDKNINIEENPTIDNQLTVLKPITLKNTNNNDQYLGEDENLMFFMS